MLEFTRHTKLLFDTERISDQTAFTLILHFEYLNGTDILKINLLAFILFVIYVKTFLWKNQNEKFEIDKFSSDQLLNEIFKTIYDNN